MFFNPIEYHNSSTSNMTNYPMKLLHLLLALFLLLTCISCGSSDVAYEGIRHPKTDATTITFQEHGIPDSCIAFAHLMMHTKENATGQELAEAMRTEAMDKGADLVLIGLARDDEGSELEESRFDYYGPEYSYNFNKTWLGWKFAFDEWNEGGVLQGFGTITSKSSEAMYPHTMMIQAVFLRCN